MIDVENLYKKRVLDMIDVRQGNIVDLRDSNNKKIKLDAIVNAAKPTLMGGSGVDGAIHSAMDRILNANGGTRTFNEEIKRELDGARMFSDNTVRCQPGQAVITKGHKKLAKYIIHAVGPKYDGGSECLKTLKDCYQNIMKLIFERREIKSVAIPIISSGSYGFSLDLAFRIALTTIGNELIKEKNRNYDAFANIEKIYLVIYTERDEEKIYKIYKECEPLLEKEKRMVTQSVWITHKSYIIEIWKNDTERRNYFTLTKVMRLLLVICRFAFFPSFIIRHFAGKKGWKFRREIIELETLLKMLIPILCLGIIGFMQNEGLQGQNLYNRTLYIGCGLTIYVMVDTITCLLSLIFLADIQGPAANQLRTLILLIFNYLEMIFGIALFYYVAVKTKISFLDALDYSVLGKTCDTVTYTMRLRIIDYTRSGIEFFFMVLTFAFFVSHLKQKKYME